MNSTITRADFVAAIQAGITAAGGLLTEPERDALRQVAVSAKHTGHSFSTGCPWSQAGLWNGNLNVGEPAEYFSSAYDLAMAYALDARTRAELWGDTIYSRVVVER